MLLAAVEPTMNALDGVGLRLPSGSLDFPNGPAAAHGLQTLVDEFSAPVAVNTFRTAVLANPVSVYRVGDNTCLLRWNGYRHHPASERI